MSIDTCVICEIEHDPSDVRPWEEVHHYWKSKGLTVVRDRHLPCGCRQHVVQEGCFYAEVLDNALVYSVSQIQKE